MRLRSHSIRWRVAIALAVMAALVLVMAVTGATSMQRAAYLLDRADKSHHQKALISELASEVNAYLAKQINALIQGDVTDELQQSRRRIASLFAEMDRYQRAEIEFLRDAGERQAERAELLRSGQIREVVASLFDAALSAPRRSSGSVPIADVQSISTRLMDTARDRLQPLIEATLADEQQEIDAVETAMQELRSQLLWLGVTVASVCVLLASIAAWHINRSIHRPISALIQATSALSSGDLHRRLRDFRRDELGLLALHFNRMAKHLERHRTELETLNAELEHRIAERTESLERSNTRLQQIDHSRKRFLANVSHELRTPLTAILGETELSIDDAKTREPELAQSLLRINANASYLRRRVQDLLLLARSEDGKLLIERRHVDLARMVADVCRQVRGIADVEQVGIRLDANVPSAPVSVDPSWMGQCLMNLIDNAVKFSMPGDTVTVGLDSDVNRWRIQVLDQGPGFDPAALPNLFDRYYQTEGGRSRGGAGLGLTIAHWIVNEHGGEISAANTERGACVTLRLPKMETAQ